MGAICSIDFGSFRIDPSMGDARWVRESNCVRIEVEQKFKPARVISLPESSQQYAALHAAAKAKFDRVANLGRIEGDLKLIAQGKVSELPAVELSYLRSARKGGLVLRASYRFFSRDNSAPRPLGNFVASFGDLNDEIEKLQKFTAKGTNTNTVHEQAQNVREKALLLSESMRDRNTWFEYLPAERDGFLGKWKKNVKKIGKFLDDPNLSIDDYHDLRKLIRDFRSILI